jgi:putative thioredoxin
MAAASPWISETTVATFEADVVERSLERPVLVDFWAPWCQPCRQLTPILEKLTEEYGGKFVLVKVNVDEAPEIAGAFRVQSIPHVFAVRDGQPINHFQGVMPETQLRQWLETILPSPAEELVLQAQELEATDPAAAIAKYREAIHLAPDIPALKIRLAQMLLNQKRIDEVRPMIEELESRGYLEPEAERIKSQLDLISAAAETGSVEQARKAAAAAPDNLSLRLKLSDALAVAGKHEEALNICLELIERDKSGIGVAAKETMVKIFDLLGPGSELVGRYRRKLATLLY